MNVAKGLFFDLDGTLVDTLHANSEAYVQAVANIGRKITHEMYESTYGMRVEVFLKKFYPDITNDEISEVIKFKSKIYPNFLHLARPNTQLINFIRTLRNDHTTALVTMAQKNNALSVLESANIDNLFDLIVAGDDVEHPKPHPEAYIKTLSMCNLKSTEVIAFEDSETGILSATSAGIAVLKISIPRTN